MTKTLAAKSTVSIRVTTGLKAGKGPIEVAPKPTTTTTKDKGPIV